MLSYGLGWTVLSYRGHRVVTHSGGIDGFRCRVAMLPDDGVGTVVLTNGDKALPHVLTWELFDSLLALKPANWSRRMREDVRKEEEETGQRRQQQRAERVRGTKPSHKLSAYVGIYQHPGYGQIQVCYEKRRLLVWLNDLDGHLAHYHYDTFESHDRRWTTPILLSFTTDGSGGISQLTALLQEGAADILFQPRQATE